MNFKFTALFVLPLFTSLCLAQGMQDAPLSQRTDTAAVVAAVHIASWSAPKVQHAYGLPESKPKVKGTLTINSSGLTFISKSGPYTIPWNSMIAVSDGNERVEMFGITGTIVRAMIPDGGGVVAAAVMHHKVYNLTIEFHDVRGAYHAAVFVVAGPDATHLLESYKQAVPPVQNPPALASLPESLAPSCSANAASRSVLVAAPTWSQAEVPAAYRGLVYEHIVDRIQRAEGIGHVYRAEEHSLATACPRYTVTISVVSFKAGSQVKRATLGPIGFFVGTTQMAFSAKITDASGSLNATDQFKVTMRGESQSQNVADGVAKKLAKYYAASVKQHEKSNPSGTTGPSLAPNPSSLSLVQR